MKIHSWILKPILVMLLGFISMASFAQGDPTDSIPDDPGALSVATVQNLKFGAFYQGASGGTLVISNTGARSVTGDVVSLNLGVTYYQASYDITAVQGAIISITNGPNATLTGSNGGSMTMQIGNSNPGSPLQALVPPPGTTRVDIGGTLNVGSPVANPPGAYSGTFYITFNYE